jgi:hypothetical protein
MPKNNVGQSDHVENGHHSGFMHQIGIANDKIVKTEHDHGLK